jgi:hypothetical protein
VVSRVWRGRTAFPRFSWLMLPGLGLRASCWLSARSESASQLFQIIVGFVTDPIERARTRGVKWTMDRVRIVICSLLPTLWVLAAGHCLADSVSGCADRCCRIFVSATEGSDHAPLTDVLSFEQSARLLNRRLGMQTGWGGLLMPADVSSFMFAELEHASAPLTVSADALGLAKCWQFYWRTASEPRAPSTVS